MDLLTEVITSLVSTGLVVAIIALLGRVYMDKKFATMEHELRLAAKTHELTLRSQIDRKERQLSEFYGPIYARLKRGRRLYQLWREGKVDRVEADVLALFVQSNEQNVETILNGSDLIVGGEIPESYIHYLVHVALWDPFLKKDPPEIPPYEEEKFVAGKFLPKFEDEIFATTETLKKELDKLYQAYGLK